MISVVLPTLNSAERLVPCLAALIPAAVEGLVREVVVADGGSTDQTLEVADDAGARILEGRGDRAALIALGCEAVRSDWLMILTPEARLGSEWMGAVRTHMADYPRSAAYFRPALEDHRARARLKEWAMAFAPPGEEQGLLLPRRLYADAGGWGSGGLARRIGAARLRALPARVFTS